jgi:Bacteriophage head to tail connecting protein
MADLGDNQKIRGQVDPRMTALEADRWSWWMHWREIADYYCPRRYRWVIVPNPTYRGAPINQRIIDNTPLRALRTLSSGMMAGITSPANQWFSLTLQDSDLAKREAVKLWLDEVAGRILRVCAVSNFYMAMSVLYEDLSAFGTAAMIIYDDPADAIRCYNPCAGEYFLAQSSRLQVDTLYRKFTLTARQCGQQFPEENLTPDVKGLLETGQGSQDRELIIGHAIEPNDVDSGFREGNLPWREVYWEWGSSSHTLLSQRGFHEFPAICPRWYLNANDVYGRSPAMDALGDNKQLQVEQKRKAQAIDKLVNPPLLADNALKNEPASMLPGGVTYVASTGQVGGMKPVYEVKPDLQWMIADIKECQDRIKETMYVDLFLMISQLDTVRTATEIIERRQEKLLMLSPVLERFQNEALDPAIRRIAKIMGRAGMLPPAPRELQGHNIQIQYTSMLAQSQRAVKTTGMERFVAMTGNLAGADPDVLDKVDFDEFIDEYGDALGVSPKFIRSAAAVAQIRQVRAKQKQAAAISQATLAGVQGAQVLSKTPVGGGRSALQAMIGGGAPVAPANAGGREAA